MNWKDIFYIPLSGLYAIGVGIRHILYDEHVLLSHSVSIPTICVGNIAVGGTGKTPHVEYLIRLLSPHYKVAVLSRGYKRKTHGFMMADPLSTAETIGDESMQLHQKFPDVAVAVCENRVKGARMLQQMVDGLQVIILDDAYQHRALRCGMYILLTTYDNLYPDDHMLPWGRLRDLKQRSLKANMVVVTKCPETMRPIDKRVISNRLHLPAFQHLYFSSMRYQMTDEPGRPLVVTGVADPSHLYMYIKSTHPTAELLSFPDHHPFTNADVSLIAERASHFETVITTEKDMQRMALTPLVEMLGSKLKVVPMEVNILDEQQIFDHQVMTYVSESIRKIEHR